MNDTQPNLNPSYRGRSGLMSKAKFLFTGIVCIALSGIASADSLPNPNLNNDNIANFYDFAIFANNWQKTGAGLAGDFDDSNTVDIEDFSIFAYYWLSQFSQYQQCQGIGIDLDGDGVIAFEDMAKFAQNWLSTGAGLVGDFDTSNSVDYNDLSIFADCWLKGSKPESIWEQFKASLAASDVNTALSFISEPSKDKYAEIFQIIGTRLPEYAAGLGDLILKSESEIEGEVKYEMTHQAGSETYLFQVIFIRDEQGTWKIDNF